MLNVHLDPTGWPQPTGSATAVPVANREQSEHAEHVEFERSTRPWTESKISVEGEPWRKVFRRWAIVLLVIAFGVLAVVFFGPILVRVSEWSFAREPDIVLPQLGTLIALATVAITGWNMLAKVKGQPDGDKASGVSLVQRIGNRASFATRALLSAAVVLVLVLLALALFADQLRGSVQWHLSGRTDIDWQLVAAAGVLLVIGLFFDQTRMSLHEFYKRRLWGAFAVERTGATNAAAIDYGVLTTLSRYGKPPRQEPDEKPAGPELLVCAAVNVSGLTLRPLDVASHRSSSRAIHRRPPARIRQDQGLRRNRQGHVLPE